MQAKWFIAAVLGIALVLGIAWQLSFYWGSLSADVGQKEVFFTSFDKETALGEENCFSFETRSSYIEKNLASYYAMANGKVFSKGKLDLSNDNTISECIAPELLALGDNFVEVHVRDNRIFYHANVVEALAVEKPAIALEYKGRGIAGLKVENAGKGYEPAYIYVNGKLDHLVYPTGKLFESDEKVSLQEGSNTIRVEFKGIAAEAAAEKEQGFAMHPALGVLLVAAMLAALFFMVFAEYPLLEKIAYSVLSFFAIVIAEFFVLEIMGVLSSFNFVVVFAATTIAIIIGFRKRLGAAGIDKGRVLEKVKNISPMLLLLLGLLVFSSFFFNFFTQSHYSVWTSFYERQSMAIAGTGEIPFTDEYSFLGTKPFGYMSGYFFVNPAVSWLLGVGTQQAFAAIMVVAQLGLVAAGLLLFRSFGFKGSRSYLALLAFMMSGFVFADFSFNIRHVISYAFLFLSVYLVRKEKPVSAALMLAFGTFVQTPVFLMFFAMLPIALTKRTQVKAALKTASIAALVALVFFAPTLLKYGIPTQAKHNVWGYMWSIPLYGFFLDYIALVVMIGVFILPFIALKRTKINRFSARVLAFLVLFVAIQLFVSYRINIVASFAFAMFVALLFPKQLLEKRVLEYCLGVLFAVTFALMFLITIAFYPAPMQMQSSFAFIKENTSTAANFLNEPYLGHTFIFLAQRKSSADLAVEYANAEMIENSFEFIKTGNQSILEKYEIDYVVNRSIFLDEKPVGSNLWHEMLEYEELDKIYANNLFFVHWNAREK